jgi:hypothetical protein
LTISPEQSRWAAIAGEIMDRLAVRSIPNGEKSTGAVTPWLVVVIFAAAAFL